MTDKDFGRISLFDQCTAGMSEKEQAELKRFMLNARMPIDDPLIIVMAQLGYIRDAAQTVPQLIRDADAQARADLECLSGIAEIKVLLDALMSAVKDGSKDDVPSPEIMGAIESLRSLLEENTAASAAFATVVDRKDKEIEDLRGKVGTAVTRISVLENSIRQARANAPSASSQQIQQGAKPAHNLSFQDQPQQQIRPQQPQSNRAQAPQVAPKAQPEPSLIERLLKRDALIAMGAAVVMASFVFLAGVQFGGGGGANEKAALSWSEVNDMRGQLAECRQKAASGSRCMVNLVVP